MGNRVLITGARAAAALDCARDFVKAGWDVHLADCVEVRMIRWSSIPAQFHRYPSPRHKAADFRVRIAKLVETHDYDLIIPSCEEVFHLASPRLRAVIGERLFAPDLSCLTQLHDKLTFATLARKWGLTTPESHAIEGPKDLEQFASDSGNWVFKPRMSRFGEHTLVTPSPDAIKAVAKDNWMAQRFVRGEEVCFHAIAHKGNLVGGASYSSPWRMRGGASYAFSPLDKQRHETLRNMAEIAVNKGQLHGQFGFDVIFDQSDAPHFIECNPRATSGLHLLTGDGQLARAVHSGEPISTPSYNSVHLAPAMILFGLPKALRRGLLRQWLRAWRAGHDAISRRGDRMPLVGALADALVFTLKGVKHNISINAATTYDIEWNGEELS